MSFAGTADARLAAYHSWAKTPDRTRRTAAARRAAEERFERLVDPDGRMSPKARALAAESARAAHFQAMALKSAKARSKR